MTSFFGELRRRNVVRVAVAYAIVGWVLIEVSSVIAPAMNLPDWATSLVVFFVILGFPLALILSWAYEITPEGIKLERDVAAGESITHVTGRKLDFAIIGALVLALGFVVIENYVLEDAELTPERRAELFEIQAEIAAAIEAELSEAEPEVLPNSVAVLPFRNDSPDPNNAYYASGIHEEILNHLVRLSALNVIARTSVEQYRDTEKSIPEIADELNVETVMEGSVRYAGGQIRITVQLNDGVTGAHLWSETYTRDFEDIFAIESDVAMNVANAIGAEFSLEEQERIETPPTRSEAAYELYLQATADIFDGRIAVETAHSLLDRAIELDPEFALAYARKATLYEPGYAEQIVELALEALSHDANLPLAQFLLGLIDVRSWRWSEGRERIARALDLAPNNPEILIESSLLAAFNGRYDEAMRDAQRALALDPNGDVHLRVSYVHLLAGRDDEAFQIAQEAYEQNPTSYLVNAWLSRLETLRGNRSEAAELALAAEEYYLEGGAGPQIVAYGLALAGLQDEAVRFAGDDTGRALGGMQIMHALVRGDQPRALEILDRLVETRSPYGPILELLVHNLWRDPVLDQPEFEATRTRFKQTLLD